MKQLLSFLLVGGSATLLQFILLILFVDYCSLNPVIASAAAFCFSAIANYLLNYHLTFRSNQAHTETLPKFIATATLGLIVNTSLFALSYHLIDHYLAAQIIATGVAVCVNFLLHKYWIYRTRS